MGWVRPKKCLARARVWVRVRVRVWVRVRGRTKRVDDDLADAAHGLVPLQFRVAESRVRGALDGLELAKGHAGVHVGHLV